MKITSIDEVDVAITVLKQSDTGMFRNERLLLIKAGYLSYYSKMPKYYVGNVRSIELSGELPKMTLCASNVESIERKRKYLHIKFNTKHLINTVQLKQIVDGEKQQVIVEDKSKGEDIQWVFKCQNIEQADVFMQQVLLCMNNPKFKPAMQNVINGYRTGKQGIRPESLMMPAPGKYNAKFRYSEQPEQVVKKFRINSIHENSFKQPGQLFSNQQKAHKNQKEIINQQANEDQPVEQQDKKSKLSPQVKNQIEKQDIKQNSRADQLQTIIMTNNPVVKDIQQNQSYGKQTFPYFPFVKSKTKTAREQLTQLKIKKIKTQGREQGLLQKLMNRKSTDNFKSTKRSTITPDFTEFKIKRSLTMDKNLIQTHNVNTKIEEQIKQKILSWSELKRAKKMQQNVETPTNNLHENIQIIKLIQQQNTKKYNEISHVKDHLVKLKIDKQEQNYHRGKQKVQVCVVQKIKQGHPQLLNQNEQQKYANIEPKAESIVVDIPKIVNQKYVNQTSTVQNVQTLKLQQQTKPNSQTDHLNVTKQIIYPIINDKYGKEDPTATNQARQQIQTPISMSESTKLQQQIKVHYEIQHLQIVKQSQKQGNQKQEQLQLQVRQPENSEPKESSMHHSKQDNSSAPSQNCDVSRSDCVELASVARLQQPSDMGSEGIKTEDNLTHLQINQPRLEELKIPILEKLKQDNFQPQKYKDEILIGSRPTNNVNNLTNLQFHESNNKSINYSIVQRKQYNQQLTPRFWEIQQPTSRKQTKHVEHKVQEVPLSCKSIKQNTIVVQARGKQMKQVQYAKVQVQAGIYSQHILKARVNDNHIGSTVSKIIKHQVTHNINNSLQLPHAVAIQLINIRKLNSIKLQAVRLMIEYINQMDAKNALNSENIIFGPRVRYNGWALYIFQSLQKQKAVWNFYQNLRNYCQDIQDEKFRCPQIFSIGYQSLHAIYIETPLNYLKLAPESAVEIFDRILYSSSLNQIRHEIKVSQGEQKLILWVNPDYLANVNLIYRSNIHKQVIDTSSGLTDQQTTNTNKVLKLITQQDFQQKQKLCSQNINEHNLIALKGILGNKKVSIEHSQSDYVQIKNRCVIKQLQNCQQSSSIDNLHANMDHYLTADIEKAHIFNIWKGLKLLAIADLPDICQSVSISQYLHVLRMRVKLLLKYQKFDEALQISFFLSRLIIGKASLRYLLAGTQSVYLSKLKLLILLTNQSEISKFVSESQQIQVILLECIIKSKDRLMHVSDLTNISQKLIIVLECIKDQAIKRRPLFSIDDVMENHNYCCMLLYWMVSEYANSNENELEIDRLQKCAYEHAKQILYSNNSQISEEALEVVICFVDKLIKQEAFIKAISLIENLRAHEKIFNQRTIQIELNSRRDLCLLSIGQIANEQQILLYLEYYMTSIFEGLVQKKQKSRSERMFSIIFQVYTKNMIGNDESAYLAVVNELISLDIADSLKKQLLEPSLCQLEPEVRRRVLSKLTY